MAGQYNGSQTPSRVVLVNPTTLEDYVPSGGGGGGGGTDASPNVIRTAQGTVTQTNVTLTANTAATLLAANANTRGARLLNYTASPVYLTNGTTGTPTSGSPSDYIPAAVSGVPGQWESPYAPVDGLRGVSAAAGGVGVIVW